MSEGVNHAYFTRRMFQRAVLASPLAAIGLALAEMGDTILVGHAVGVDGLAAVGFASPLFLLASFFMFGLSMGGAIVYSNLMHEGKKEDALGVFHFFLRLSAAVGFGLTAAGLFFNEGLLSLLGTGPEDGAVYEMTKGYIFYLLLGIPFEILMEVLTSYLRNDDADAFSVAVQTASGVGNLAVSALLLLVFDWGLAGCSFGFFISNFLAVLASLAYILYVSKGELTLRGKAASFREAVKPLRLGFSTSSEYIFDAVFTLAAIHLLMDMAGTEGVAIFNIIENLSVLFIFLYEMIGKTSQPLFSTFFAECNFAELHRVFRYALAYSLLWGVLGTMLVVLYPQILTLLFGMEDITDVSMAYYAAQIFCIGTIFMGIALLLQNYLQSEEDESGAFLVVFLRRLGVSLPLAYVLAQFGFYAFWLVYPLAELLTLAILYLYKKNKKEHRTVAAERVYAASFLGNVEDMTEKLDEMEAFAISWKADKRQINDLRLAVEEICALVRERAPREEDSPTLTQITVIAKEDGHFQLHMRDDGKEMNPFQITLKQPEKSTEEPDTIALGLHVVKSHAQQFLYRNYHGFNTMTVTI